MQAARNSYTCGSRRWNRCSKHLLQHANFDVARIPFGSIHAVGDLDEIVFVRFEDVRHVLLRIAVDEGEPRALDVYHDAVSPLERVQNIPQFKRNFGDLIGHERFGLLIAFPETSAKDFGAD